jgi:uncharacterized protein with HEPN domain
MKRDLRLYIADILENMDNASKFVEGLNPEGLRRDSKTAYAVVRCFEIIGEAAKQVPLDVRERYPSIPWRTMSGMRDKMIHAYFGIDYEALWKAVTENIPRLRPLVQSLFEELPRNRPNENNSNGSLGKV